MYDFCYSEHHNHFSVLKLQYTFIVCMQVTNVPTTSAKEHEQKIAQKEVTLVMGVSHMT